MVIDRRVLITLAVRGDETDVLRLTNLIMSMAHFGGAMTNGRYLVLVTGAMAPKMVEALTSYGVEVRQVPSGTRALHPLLWLENERDFDVAVVLDSGSMVAGDFSGYVTDRCIGARLADECPLSVSEWERAAAHLDRDLTRMRLTLPGSGEDAPPYFDPGLLIVPRLLLAEVCGEWRETAERLATLHLVDGDPSVLAAQALSFVLHRSRLPVRVLPLELGFPVGRSLHPICMPDAVQPLVLRYRGLTADGRLPVSPHAEPNVAVARVNALLASLDHASAGTPAPLASQAIPPQRTPRDPAKDTARARCGATPAPPPST